MGRVQQKIHVRDNNNNKTEHSRKMANNNVQQIREEIRAGIHAVEVAGRAREAEKEALLDQVREAKARLRELAKDGRGSERRIMELRLRAGERILEAAYPTRTVNRWRADRETWEYRCYAVSKGTDLDNGWTEDPRSARAEVHWSSDEAEDWLDDGHRLGMLPEEHERVRDEREEQREADHRATFNGAYDYAGRPDSDEEDVAEWIR